MRVHSYGDPGMTVPIRVRSFGDPLVRALIFGAITGVNNYRLPILALILLIM